MSTELFELRCVVDECDRRIAQLLAERSAAVAAIHNIKREVGAPTRDRVRELAVVSGAYARMRACNGRYTEETIRRIYEAVFDGCEHLEAAVPSPDDVGGRGAPRF